MLIQALDDKTKPSHTGKRPVLIHHKLQPSDLLVIGRRCPDTAESPVAVMGWESVLEDVVAAGG